MHTSLIRRGALVCAVLAIALPAAAGAAIVVASSGPSAGAYPVGRKLADGVVVTLKAGDKVTVLDAHGTRVLTGAGTFAIAGSASGAVNPGFAPLTRARAAQRVRTGAVRAGPGAGPVRSPNLWYVDPAQSGAWCLADTNAVRLWRADATKAATVVVSDTAGKSASIIFPIQAMTANWNTSVLPVHDGTTYRVTINGKAAPPLAIHLLSLAPGDPEGLAAALVGAGCKAQLDLLSASLAAG